MGVYIKNWSLADWKELLKWAKIGANNAMIGEFAEVEEIPPHGDLFDITKVIITPSDDEDIAYEIDFGNTIIPAEPFNNLSKPCKDDADFPICTKASPASLGIYKKAEEGER